MAFRDDLTNFGAFYERTYQSAYRTALAIVRNGVLAADVTQDAYLAAYRHRDAFRGDSPSGVWLHRIVVNQALMVLRRRRPFVGELRVDELAPSADAAITTRMALFDALAELSPRHRAAVVLRYYHDYDYATIAGCLGTTTSNVGAMLTRALDRLKVVLDRADPATAGRDGEHVR
jgi:RNA polymerase sigma-70 factor (ECF subfamily)